MNDDPTPPVTFYYSTDPEADDARMTEAIEKIQRDGGYVVQDGKVIARLEPGQLLHFGMQRLRLGRVMAVDVDDHGPIIVRWRSIQYAQATNSQTACALHTTAPMLGGGGPNTLPR